MRPVIILMTSRTGSSMVAGIFAHHGLWCGEEYYTGSGLGKDYLSYETVAVKEWLRPRYGLQGATLVSDELADEFRAFIGNLVPKGPRWMVKCGVMFWPIFAQFEPHLIFVKRNFESSVAAIMGRPGAAGEAEVRSVIERRYALMDAIQAKHGGRVIDTDALIDGDFTGIKAAFDYCGLEFVEDLARQVIDPELWHFRNA